MKKLIEAVVFSWIRTFFVCRQRCGRKFLKILLFLCFHIRETYFLYSVTLGPKFYSICSKTIYFEKCYCYLNKSWLLRCIFQDDKFCFVFQMSKSSLRPPPPTHTHTHSKKDLFVTTSHSDSLRPVYIMRFPLKS